MIPQFGPSLTVNYKAGRGGGGVEVVTCCITSPAQKKPDDLATCESEATFIHCVAAIRIRVNSVCMFYILYTIPPMAWKGGMAIQDYFERNCAIPSHN